MKGVLKTCTKCGRELSVIHFGKDRSKKDGLRPSCKDCKKLGDVKYILKNRKKVLLKLAEYRKNHREELAYKERVRRNNFSDEARIEYNRKKLIYVKSNSKKRQEIVAIDFSNGKAKRLGIEGKLTVNQWRELKKKYNYTCLYCKKQEPETSLTIDHIIPFSRGGLNNIENIQPLCGYCNKSKGVKEVGVIRNKVEGKCLRS